MKKWTAVVISLLLAGTASGASPQEVMKNILQKNGGAICVVRCEVLEETGTQVFAGIGICLDASGLVMTSVIDPRRVRIDTIEKIELVSPGSDGKILKAKLLGVDGLTGLAFVRAEEAHTWTAVAFAPKAELSLGDMVVSLGVNLSDSSNPLSLGMGYVSCLQYLPMELCRVTGGTLSDSGSVVFDDQGRAVGIVGTQPFLRYNILNERGNTMQALLRSDERTISFLPVESFADLLTNIPQDGQLRRLPWIGARFVPVTPNLAEAKDITEPAVMVDQIIPGQPADKAGLRDRDFVIAVDGAPLEKMGNPEMTAVKIQQVLARKPLDKPVTLTVITAGQKRNIQVFLKPMPKLPIEASRLLSRELGLWMREKVEMDRLADRGPTAGVNGLIVLRISPRSPADQAGLRVGDLVVSIDGQAVTNVVDAEPILRSALDRKSGYVSMEVQRGASREKLVLRLAPEVPTGTE